MKPISKKKIIVIACCLLAIVAAVCLAQWKWNFLHFESAQNNQAATEAVIAADNPDGYVIQPPDNSGEIKTVLSAHLFGQEGAAKKTATAVESLPKTQQPLELRGIFFNPKHPEQSTALIAQAGGEAKDYRTGDELLPMLAGYKIYLIEADSVQIEHDGSVELLELLRNVAEPNNQTNPVPTAAASQQPVEENQQPVDANAAPPAVGNDPIAADANPGDVAPEEQNLE